MWRRRDFCLRENKTRRHCGGPEGAPYSRRTCHAQVSAKQIRCEKSQVRPRGGAYEHTALQEVRQNAPSIQLAKHALQLCELLLCGARSY
eukprot:6178551-Prymnesium_polylepis.1